MAACYDELESLNSKELRQQLMIYMTEVIKKFKELDDIAIALLVKILSRDDGGYVECKNYMRELSKVIWFFEGKIEARHVADITYGIQNINPTYEESKLLLNATNSLLSRNSARATSWFDRVHTIHNLRHLAQYEYSVPEVKALLDGAKTALLSIGFLTNMMSEDVLRILEAIRHWNLSNEINQKLFKMFILGIKKSKTASYSSLEYRLKILQAIGHLDMRSVSAQKMVVELVPKFHSNRRTLPSHEKLESIVAAWDNSKINRDMEEVKTLLSCCMCEEDKEDLINFD
jgi:hypothetical protein